MALKQDAMIVAGVAFAALAVAWYLKNKVGGAVAAVAPYVNPMDERNLAYSGANALGGALSGNDNFDLGYAVYDVLPPETIKRGVDFFNPLSERSMTYMAGSAIGSGVYDAKQKVTTFGEGIGSAFYDTEQAIRGWFK